MKVKVSLVRLFWIFFKIGIFTFGGGMAMIPLIEKEIVNNHWIDKNDIMDIIALSQTIPGAIAVNMSLFVGYKSAKKLGAIVAVLGCILPSYIILLLIAIFLTGFQNLIIVQHAFIGILSAIAALIIVTAYKLAKHAVIDWVTFVITAVATILLTFTAIEPIFIILGGAAVGILIYYFVPKKVKKLFPEEADNK